MAGQHDLHNHQIAVKFPHNVWRRIEIAAEQAANIDPNVSTPGAYIRSVVMNAVANIPITADDAQLIADRIRLAEERGKMV